MNFQLINFKATCNALGVVSPWVSLGFANRLGTTALFSTVELAPTATSFIFYPALSGRLWGKPRLPLSIQYFTVNVPESGQHSHAHSVNTHTLWVLFTNINTCDKTKVFYFIYLVKCFVVWLYKMQFLISIAGHN